MVDEVFSVDIRDVDRAKDIVLAMQTLSARDALHIAVMERHSVNRVLTFDSGFDTFPGIARMTA